MREKIQYYVLCITEFARRRRISEQKAFRYLDMYGGLAFLVDCYEAEHTLSLDTVIEDLTLVCNNNGGNIV
jgi:hypothetical protein